MNAHKFGALIGLGVLTASASAAPVPITNNSVATQSAVTGGLVGLDISGVVSGLTTSNSLVHNFSTGAYSGTLSATVYGNVGAPGGGLNTVVIVYEFTGNGPTGIEKFAFGQNGGNALDLGDLAAATQGSIGDMTTIGQTVDSVTIVDNSALPANDTYNFNFNANNLGGASTTETFSWYVMTTGDVQIGTTTVEVTNFGAITFDMLALVDIPGQPDLSVVPLPGAASLGLAGLAFLGARRRR